jgi:DNA polymerase
MASDRNKGLMRLHLDCETASTVDLKKVGTDVYANHADTKVLMLAYAFDDGPVSLWEPHLGSIPEDLLSALTNNTITKISWNVGFEFSIISAVLQIPLKIEEWFDPMAYARYLGYPGHLADAGDALSLPQEFAKNPIGKKLIKMFSMPTRATKKVPAHFKDWITNPEEWKTFGLYCVQDVVSERAILHELEKKAPFPEIERKTWILDQKINQRGIPINLEFVGKALAIAESARAGIIEQLKVLTGCANPNSPAQLKSWFDQQGLSFDSLDKSHVVAALETNLSQNVRDVLELKQLLGGIAFKKLPVIQNRTRNERLCEAFTYHAAHTGRWASRGVQFHNLLKPTKQVAENYDAIVTAIMNAANMPANIHPIEAIGGTLRASVQAPKGKQLMVADYSSIENRVLAWLAQCPGMLQVFQKGLDPYKSFAALMYKISYDEVTKAQRNFCKSPVLGCGFGMGWNRLIAYAAQMGQKITEDQAKELVYAWREAYPEVPDYWKALGNAAVRAVTFKEQYQLGPLRIDGRDPNMLHIVLPSGRALHYDKPFIDVDMYMKKIVKYYGPGGAGGGWGVIEARGSSLVENVVQAIARDLLVNGMMNATEAGFEIVLHVHDEIVCETPLTSLLTYDMFEECMVKSPTWGEDIPLAVEGYQGQIYRKG